MSLLGHIQEIRVWTSEIGSVGKRLSVSWTMRGVTDNFVAFSGAHNLWLIPLESVHSFLSVHKECTWLIGRSLSDLYQLSMSFNWPVMPLIRQRQLIHLGTLYKLVVLAEFGDIAEDSSVHYLSKVYLDEICQTSAGDFFPALAATTIRTSGINRSSADLWMAAEDSIATWNILPLVWREAKDFSGESVLLGYTEQVMAEYALARSIKLGEEY